MRVLGEGEAWGQLLVDDNLGMEGGEEFRKIPRVKKYGKRDRWRC